MASMRVRLDMDEEISDDPYVNTVTSCMDLRDELDGRLSWHSDPMRNLTLRESTDAFAELRNPNFGNDSLQFSQTHAFINDDDESMDDIHLSRRIRSSLGSESTGEEWSTIRNGCIINLNTSTSADDTEEGSLFIPEPLLHLSTSNSKPHIPYHTKEDLPVGASVWVVDEEDVELLLNKFWNASYRSVCNGKLEGTVVRHTGDHTIVSFHDQRLDLDFSFTLPRACLSLQAIEPYESSPRTNHHVLSTYTPGLGPRATAWFSPSNSPSMLSHTPHLNMKYYEALPSMIVEVPHLTDLVAAQQHFNNAEFEEALFLATHLLGDETGKKHRSDILLFHSRVLVFLERYEEALDEARELIQLEPNWVRGYLSAARACSGLGQFAEAGRMIHRASLLLTHSSEIERIEEMNSYLLHAQNSLHGWPGVMLTLDRFYRKRLRLCRDYPKGDVICVEPTVVGAVASLFEPFPANHCCQCLRCGAEDREVTRHQSMDSHRSYGVSGDMESLRASPNGVSVGSSMEITSGLDISSAVQSQDDQNRNVGADIPRSPAAYFCNDECQKRASVFLPMEMGKHRESVELAKELLRNRSKSSLTRGEAEMSNVVIRLFLILLSIHRRLAAQWKRQETKRIRATISDEALISLNMSAAEREQYVADEIACLPQLAVEVALQHLGLYPFVVDHLRESIRNDITDVYEVLTSKFNAEEKAIYSSELFINLYSLVCAYSIAVTVSSTTNQESELGDTDAGSFPACHSLPLHRTLFYLPRVVCCVDRVADDTGIGSNFGYSAGANGVDSLTQAKSQSSQSSEQFKCDRFCISANCEVRLVDSNSGSYCQLPTGDSVSQSPLLQLVATRDLCSCDKLLLASACGLIT